MDDANGFCQRCGAPLLSDGRRRRPALYCSASCRKAAHRLRRPPLRNLPETPDPGDESQKGPLLSSKRAETGSVIAATVEFRDTLYQDTLKQAKNSPAAARTRPSYLAWVLGKDAASDLERAAARFQEKPTWGHARPEVVRAHPALAANGLQLKNG